MESGEIRKKFLEFFKARGHAVLPSTSLIPENDPSVLFITAGMQPLVPYLLGEAHPQGKRLANIQRCVRTQDIDEVGDATHDTFFEMLGNWSLGDPDAEDGIGAGYFKEEAIKWSYEFLTSKEEGLGLDPSRLYITCFEGNEDAPRDIESAEIWKSLGISENRIYFLGIDDNWWSPGDSGPCGPDTEMFYDITSSGLNLKSKEEFLKADQNQQVVEIWNDVFMEYEKKDGKIIGKLGQKNVDTGAGLERLAMVMQGVDNIFDTDLFAGLMRAIEEKAYEFDIKSARIVADHVRTSVFMIADGVTPSNTDRGYILRRLIRRAIRHADKLSFSDNKLSELVPTIIEKYKQVYPNLKEKEEEIKSVLDAEEEKFENMSVKNEKPAVKFIREFETAHGQITGDTGGAIFQRYGIPVERTLEIAKELDISISDRFEDELKQHKEKHRKVSKKGVEKKFKGGLGDTSEQSVKYHTATHLLNAALREVLGDHVEQRGSNITPERLRFDFSHPERMTDEEKQKVEELVNKAIESDLPVMKEEMSLDEARDKGAVGVFGEKYGERVTVYTIGDDKKGVVSQEICGGPHVENTGALGKFRIVSEKSSSTGIRRIKAVLE